VRLLLASGARHDIVNNGGDTALIWFDWSSDEAVVRLLAFTDGAKLDIANSSGHTALILATAYG
jgi:ankyrin repeat protein